MRLVFALLGLLAFAGGVSAQPKVPPQAPGLDGKVKALEAQVALLQKQIKDLQAAKSGVVVKPEQKPVGSACICGVYCQCSGQGTCGCGMHAAAPNTVCQNGVCRVVSQPTQVQSCSNGSCSGGCCGSGASGGWRPGKFLSRFRR